MHLFAGSGSSRHSAGSGSSRHRAPWHAADGPALAQIVSQGQQASNHWQERAVTVLSQLQRSTSALTRCRAGLGWRLYKMISVSVSPLYRTIGQINLDRKNENLQYGAIWNDEYGASVSTLTELWTGNCQECFWTLHILRNSTQLTQGTGNLLYATQRLPAYSSESLHSFTQLHALHVAIHTLHSCTHLTQLYVLYAAVRTLRRPQADFTQLLHMLYGSLCRLI